MKWIVPTATALVLAASTGAFAQTTPQTTPPATEPAPPAVTAPSVQPAPAQTKPKLTEEQAKALINATVVSSDDQNLGDVAAIQRDSDGNVLELHADIGGFLGIGQTRVRVLPSQFTVTADNRILLTVPAAQAKELPKIEN